MIFVTENSHAGPVYQGEFNIGEAAILFALPGETVTATEKALLRDQLATAGSVEFRPGITFTRIQ